MVSVIVNPSAGGGRAVSALPAVQAELRRLGVEHHLEYTTSLEHARDLAREAARAGEVAVAYGGDGLVGAVAGVLQDGEGVLGVLPGGRGNDLARCLAIPLDPVAACSVLADGRPTAIDLGTVGGRTFVGIATCGFDARANRIANETRLPLGGLVYAYGALRALLSWKPIEFSLRLDGEPFTFTGYSVAVANSARHGGGMLVAPAASLEDGMFDVVMVMDAPKLSFLRQLPRVFDGRHVDSPYVRIVRAREVEISADRPSDVYADGDPIAVLPTKLTVAPGAVRVLVPAR